MIFIVRKEMRKCLSGQMDALEVSRQLDAGKKLLANNSKKCQLVGVDQFLYVLCHIILMLIRASEKLGQR